MANRVLLLAFGAVALSTGALALPVNKVSADRGIVLARTVCNDEGECWHQTTPAEGIIGGVLGGLEGRSVHRDRDYDRDIDRGDGDHRRWRDDGDRRDDR